MPDCHDMRDAASELARFRERHRDLAWLDAVLVGLAGTLRGERHPRVGDGGVPVTRHQCAARSAHPRMAPARRVPRRTRATSPGAHA